MAACWESLTCSELLGAAIGSPEAGNLNFTLLHQVLLAILRRLNLENVPVNQVQHCAIEQQSQTDSLHITKEEVRSNIHRDESPDRTEEHVSPNPSTEALWTSEQEDPEPIISFPESKNRLDQSPDRTEEHVSPKSSLASVQEDPERNTSFVESKDYHELLSTISQLQSSVEDLRSQLGEQDRISKAILPSVEQLALFRSNRNSSLHTDPEAPLDYLSLANRLDKIDESVAKLTSMAFDTVLEFSRMEKTFLPYMDGGEMTIMRAQLDNINRALKETIPGFRAHCSSVSVLRSSRPSNMDAIVPVNFYRYAAPDSVRPNTQRRSTIKHQPEPDLGKEIDTIRTVLSSLIARLPLPDAIASGDESTASSISLELTSDSIRAVWQREFEELFSSSQERIEDLEATMKQRSKQLDEVIRECSMLKVEIEGLKSTAQTIRDVGWEQNSDLRHRMMDINDRLNTEHAATSAHLIELDHRVDNRVDYDHFQTRLPKETFHRTIGELQSLMDARVEYFTNELNAILMQLNVINAELDRKTEQNEMQRLETRIRRRFTYVHTLVNNVRRTIDGHILAAATTIKLSKEPLRCLSCSHEATMRAQADIIPTGTSLRVAEKLHDKRVRQLNMLAAGIASSAIGESSAIPPKPPTICTAKADMVQPVKLAYNVRPNGQP